MDLKGNLGKIIIIIIKAKKDKYCGFSHRRNLGNKRNEQKKGDKS